MYDIKKKIILPALSIGNRNKAFGGQIKGLNQEPKIA